MIFQERSTDFTRSPGHMFQIQSRCSVSCPATTDSGEPPGATPCEASVPGGPGPNRRRGASAARGLPGRVCGPLGSVRPPPGYLVFEVCLGTILPLLKHVRQLVQATPVKVEDLVLALAAGDNELTAGAGLVAERPWGERKDG